MVLKVASMVKSQRMLAGSLFYCSFCAHAAESRKKSSHLNGRMKNAVDDMSGATH